MAIAYTGDVAIVRELFRTSGTTGASSPALEPLTLPGFTPAPSSPAPAAPYSSGGCAGGCGCGGVCGGSSSAPSSSGASSPFVPVAAEPEVVRLAEEPRDPREAFAFLKSAGGIMLAAALLLVLFTAAKGRRRA